MIRPGSRVNSPVITSAPRWSPVIVQRWAATAPRRAEITVRTRAARVNTDRRWIQLNGPTWRRPEVPNALGASLPPLRANLSRIIRLRMRQPKI